MNWNFKLNIRLFGALIALLESGKKIEAIKTLRDSCKYGAVEPGLLVCKLIVDAIQEGRYCETATYVSVSFRLAMRPV